VDRIHRLKESVTGKTKKRARDRRGVERSEDGKECNGSGKLGDRLTLVRIFQEATSERILDWRTVS
jgi:hypothetical protein